MIVWQNGHLLSESDVKISPFDPGLTVGRGVFETILSVNCQVFAWERHCQRLQKSANLVGISIPQLSHFEEVLEMVVEANSDCVDRCRVRVTLTEGGNLLVTARPFEDPSLGARVATVDLPINEKSPLCHAKSLSYAENFAALEMAKEMGAEEGIRANTEGEIAEACLSNVFFVKDGLLHTPCLDTGCLPGVTRELILELFPQTLYGRWPIEYFEDAEEVWLTSSIRRVQWVSHLDGRELGDPSSYFHEVHSKLDQLVAEMWQDLD